MNRRFNFAARFLLLSLLAAGCAHQRASRELRQFRGNIVANPAADPVFAGARSSVVAVESFDARGKLTGYGTGFYFGTDRIGTCLHVIDAGHSLQIVLADGRRFSVAGVFGTDPLTDLAVLWVTNPPPENRFLPVRNNPPEVGEPVQTIAAPRQLPITVTRGQVLGQFQLGTEMLNEGVELSVPAMPGFSGGPALDAEGHVVGVMSAVFHTASGKSSMAVPTGGLGDLAGPMTPPLPWDQWIAAHPPMKSDVAALLRAGEQSGLNRPELAIEFFNRAITQDPNCTKAWMRKGYCLFQMGRPADAAGAFSRALALEPGLISPRMFLSMSLGMNGQPAEAERELAPLLATRPHLSMVQTWHGVCRMALGDPVGALPPLREAVRLSPDSAVAHLALGSLWDSFGETAAAEREYRAAIRLQASKSRARVALATLLLEVGRAEEAEKLLEGKQDLESIPGTHALRLLLAVKRGDTRAASRSLKDYVAAERKSPHPASIRPTLDSLLRQLDEKPGSAVLMVEHVGLIMLLSGRNDLARAAFAQLVQFTPDTGENWFLLARAAYLTGRIPEAESTARRALELKPAHAGAALILGQSLASRGDWTTAREWLNRAAGLKAKNVEALLALAAVEAHTGNSGKAAEFVAEARRIKADLPDRWVQNPAAYFPDRAAIHAAAQGN